MAATIAKARGFNKAGDPQNRDATRLGHGCAEAEANTWHTFAKVTMYADGSGDFTLTRDGREIFAYRWNREGEK